jgi:hypothetical protein
MRDAASSRDAVGTGNASPSQCSNAYFHAKASDVRIRQLEISVDFPEVFTEDF